MSEVLVRLAEAGVRQIVVTNKRQRPTAAILAACGLAPLLERSTPRTRRNPPYADKVAMAQAAQARCAIPSDRLLVIGDSLDDLQMADACAAAFAAAAYGYGDAVAAIASQSAARRGAAPALVVLRAPAQIGELVMSGDAVAES